MPFIRRLLVLAAMLASPLTAPAQSKLTLEEKPSVNPEAAMTVVVFNRNDPESRSLAEFYAGKRGIPADHLVGLACPLTEEISRADYDEMIAEPLRKAFTSNFWWSLRSADDVLGPVETNKIRFVALMRGMPLKISAAPDYEGDKPIHSSPIGEHNEAAVDSELSTLSLRQRNISGAITNPFYRSFKTIRDARRPEMLLVTRLDGPTPATVRRMIEDGLAAEQTGLRGFAYIDARGLTSGGLKEGDDWLQNAANSLQRSGMPVILDKGEGLFPEGYPMRQAALYFGWYAGDVGASFNTRGFRFVPGAVACHIHSYSAVSLRNPRGQWAAPLLELGAAATMGNVYEPYLALTPNIDLFVDRLRAGFTFAESAYASTRVLSWMTTFVGDPLYRPFPLLPAQPDGKGAAEWDAYAAGARKWFESPPDGEALLKASAQKLRSGVIWEGLGILQIRANNAAAGIASFEQARKAYTNEEDIMRCTIHQLIQLKGTGQEEAAVALAKRESAAHKSSPATAVLKMLVPAAFPTPTPTATPTAPK